MRAIVFLLLSIFVIANLAADNEAWEVTTRGSKKVDLSKVNYFGPDYIGEVRTKRNAQSTLKTNSITWNLVYQDVTSNTGVGFDDPVEGPKVNLLHPPPPNASKKIVRMQAKFL